MIGGLTQRVPYDCTQPYSVNAKPCSCSPKYSTMSLRSNSPCTSTSSPISSCTFERLPDLLFDERVVGGRRHLAVASAGGARCAPRRSAGTSRSSWSGRGEARPERGAAWRTATSCGRSGSVTAAARCFTAALWIRVDVRRPASALALASSSAATVARPRPTARVSVATSVSFCFANASQPLSSGSSFCSRSRSTGTCASEQDGATHRWSRSGLRLAALEQTEGGAEIALPDVAPVDHAERQDAAASATPRAARRAAVERA